LDADAEAERCKSELDKSVSPSEVAPGDILPSRGRRLTAWRWSEIFGVGL
jgi:hypothetical protein